jgi:hypothetical protein
VISLETLQSRNYVVEVRQHGEQHYLTVHELGIIASGDTIDIAFRELDRKKTEYFEHYLLCGTADKIPFPKDAVVRKDLRPFIIKATAVALVGAFLLSFASISFTYALREPLRKLGQRAGRAAIHQFVGGLNDFAAQEITASKEEKIRLAIRAIIPKLMPYVAELRPLLENTDNSQ